MVQRGMRTADVARAINCNVRTVSRLRQRYRETGRTADHPRTGRPRVTTPAQDRNPSISAQTFRNSLRDAGLRACRPVVRQVLTRHHRQQRRLWAQTHLSDLNVILTKLHCVFSPSFCKCYSFDLRYYSQPLQCEPSVRIKCV
uniref:Transposase Tc1-like domain-containing protein n=1 Tax=Sander lucioperca TaxID=283035 RepID=A0A8D0A4Y6_SANLU